MFLPMKRKVLAGAFAAFAAIVGINTEAAAGGMSAPGYTSGLPIYAILPKGMYYLNQTQSNERSVAGDDIRTNSNIFFFYYQSDMEIAGGAVSYVLAPTLFDYTSTGGYHALGMYNTYLASQIDWEIADGLYFGARLGGYVPQDGELAYDYGAIEPRFGFTYMKDGWLGLANFIFGFPAGGTAGDMAPNYFLADFSITKAFGKWTIGPVAHTSTDLDTPYPGYEKQSQFAVGGLIGYDLGGATLQTKLTTDLTEENYGGKETALWTNLILKLW
ncbi:transporter [Methyloligella solikamskensis]|uniref:Transporter n=1 Tax=Methyloligella solikamskensis TaxID=1177756 RepID=A0ABW3J7P1_9HYPH